MNYIAELIAVGTELLLGDIVNTDAQFISQGLSQIGIGVHYHTVVGDNPQRLKEAVAIAKKRANILITTGGLGPTYDDLTKQTLCESFGQSLQLHEPSAQKLRDYFKKNGRGDVPANSMQQAMLPDGCDMFENTCGTAPGCAFFAEDTHVVMLPGPPRECSAMFHLSAMPYLRQLSDEVIFSRNIRVFGMGEPAVENKLKGIMSQMENPSLAPYAKEGEVLLRVTAKAASLEEAQTMVAPVVQMVQERLGDSVYGVDVDSMESLVLRLLEEHGLTFGAGESCTGGVLAHRFTDLPGASNVFLGSVVAYSPEAKMKLLNVPKETLEQHGTVSPETAVAMAKGAREALGADLGVGITGVAGPATDERGQSVGLVYTALAAEDGTWVKKLRLGEIRNWVRIMASLHALDMIRRRLQGLPIEKVETLV